MHGADGGGGEGFEDEIAVRDGVEAVGGGAVEAQGPGRHLAVDGVGRAGQRRRAERAFIEAFAGVEQAPGVAAEHFHIGQQMVAEGHRLGILQMGEAGQDGVGFFFRTPDQRHLQRAHLDDQRVDGVAHIELEIGGDLVVARAGGVQASRGIADLFAQAALDIHVNVLKRPRECEIAALDFGQHLG